MKNPQSALYCVSLIALSLAACSGDPAPPIVNPLEHSKFAGEPAEGYQPRRPPCPPDLTPSDRPILQLRTRDSVELYLPNAELVPVWGIDYEVWPPHRTDGISVIPEFDGTRTIASRVKDERCPTELAASELAVDSTIDDVIRLRIEATSESDATRDAVLFYPHGSRSVVIELSNIEPSPDFEGDWFVAIQPLWGERRVSLQRVPPGAVRVSVPAVPVGPTLVHAIRTNVVKEGPVEGTLEAPAGFSELWPHLVSQWYAATLLTLRSDEVVTPAVVIGHGGRWQRLGLLLPQPFDPARPNIFITLAKVNEPRAVPIPCGSPSVLRVLGTGTAKLTLGSSNWQATPTSSATLNPVCPSGADHVVATLTGSSGRQIESFVSIVGGIP